tara:strand:+ start:601 stop:1770 length:1170 start_codon:yes stop_codon:yes gene_type:complete
MQNQIFYLDHNATTPIHPQVVAAMANSMVNLSANPSSTHTLGRKSRLAIEEAREAIAEFIQAPAREIIFTSGGTESDNMAILGHNWQKGDELITSLIEHPAIDSCFEVLEQLGVVIHFVKLNISGVVDFEDFKSLLSSKTKVISLIWAHNETGLIQDIPKIAAYLKEKSLDKQIFFHSDAVQALSRSSQVQVIDGLSALSLSSHKINGPKGLGALWVKGGREIVERQFGGNQEREMRPGTENLHSIIGMAEAVKLWSINGDVWRNSMAYLRDEFELQIVIAIPGVMIHAQDENRLVNTSLIAFPGFEADMLLLGLDMAGIQVSAGSACAAGAVKASRVVRNLGFDDSISKSTLRFSFGAPIDGFKMTKEDVSLVVSKVQNLIDIGGGIK